MIKQMKGGSRVEAVEARSRGVRSKGSALDSLPTARRLPSKPNYAAKTRPFHCLFGTTCSRERLRSLCIHNVGDASAVGSQSPITARREG